MPPSCTSVVISNSEQYMLNIRSRTKIRTRSIKTRKSTLYPDKTLLVVCILSLCMLYSSLFNLLQRPPTDEFFL